jgi:hypothetical protein
MLTAFNDKLVDHAVDNGYKLVADVVDDNIQRFAEFRHKVLNLRRISVHRLGENPEKKNFCDTMYYEATSSFVFQPLYWYHSRTGII